MTIKLHINIMLQKPHSELLTTKNAPALQRSCSFLGQVLVVSSTRGAVLVLMQINTKLRGSGLQTVLVDGLDALGGKPHPNIAILFRPIHAPKGKVVQMCGPKNPFSSMKANHSQNYSCPFLQQDTLFSKVLIHPKHHVG